MHKKLFFVILLAVASTYISYTNYWPAYYESYTAKQKQDFIWQRAMADKGQPSTFTKNLSVYSLRNAKYLGGQDISSVGHNISDKNPLNHRKFIHAVGKHAKVKVIFKKNLYTGLFSEKVVRGLLRASAEDKPSPKVNKPGMALKLFRDKVPSANIQALWDTFGQHNTKNFFENPMSNHVNLQDNFSFGPKFLINKLLNQKFEQQTEWTSMTGLSDVAKYKGDGTEVSNPKAPFAIVFRPNQLTKKKCMKASLEEYNYGCLRNLRKGSHLYQIYAVHEPVKAIDVKKPTYGINKEVTKEGTLHLIGHIILDSMFHDSKFIDEQVHFRHVLWEEETRVLKKPEWADKTKLDRAFLETNGAGKYQYAFPDSALHPKRRLKRKTAIEA